MILLQLSSNAMYAVHFFMLNAITGSVTILIGLLRNFVLCKYASKWAQWRGWIPLFTAAYAVTMPAWIIYEIHTFSISGVVSDTFSMASIAVSFFRYGWKALDGDGES